MKKKEPNKAKPPTPWHELRRYGLIKAFVSWWTFSSLTLGFLAGCWIPFDDSSILNVILNLHLVLFGIGFTVFGFTILGGKDDFFQTILAGDTNMNGLRTLRELVLYLFWPVLLHGLVLLICIIGVIITTQWTRWPILITIWRCAYAVIAIYAILQTYVSLKMLFSLAIIRLFLKWDEINKEREKDESGASDSGASPFTNSPN